MNRNQAIVLIGAGVVLNLIKAARPAWLDGEENARFLGIFDTSTLMLSLGAVAAVSAVLMVIFQARKPRKTKEPPAR